MSGGHTDKMTHTILNSYVSYEKFALVVFVSPNITVFLCRAVSELSPSGKATAALFYVVRPSISDYANMLIRAPGTTLSILLWLFRPARRLS
jgi:hypothetical protein